MSMVDCGVHGCVLPLPPILIAEDLIRPKAADVAPVAILDRKGHMIATVSEPLSIVVERLLDVGISLFVMPRVKNVILAAAVNPASLGGKTDNVRPKVRPTQPMFHAVASWTA
jgi:hypothetical protein